MKLFHISRADLVPAILAEGLDPRKARKIIKAVWLVSRTGGYMGGIRGALVHTLAKPHNKGLTLADLVVVEVELPRSWIARRWKGVWICPRLIAAERIRNITPAPEWGRKEG